MIDLEQPEIRFAVHAVRQASMLVQQIQAELVSPALTKEDRSPVTVADFAAQSLMGYLLSLTFPNDVMVAEEDSTALRSPDGSEALEQVLHFVQDFVLHANSDLVCRWIDHGRVDSAKRFWTLDPIDGTKGFLRGDQYVTALALVVDGEVQIGVLGCPNLVDAYRTEFYGPGALVAAVRGQGTWTSSLSMTGDWEQLHVSARKDPREGRILRSFESGHTNVDQIDQFTKALDIQREPLQMDSQAKYAVLASGKGDLLLRMLSTRQPGYKEKIWDQAAGSIILEEAGGCITDLDGKPLDFKTGRSLVNNRGVLASNTWLHKPALDALRSIGA